MDWSFKKFENDCIIEVPGNIFNDVVTESLKEFIKDLSDNDYKVFFLDMSQISKVNSKSLASIINIYQFANCYDIEIKLFNLHPYVSQLIYQTRLNQIFDICDPSHEIYSKNSVISINSRKTA
ncbi:MAG TPA: STAS domain-containing protein [Candidatus Gastranaerophilales bacterium]|nr:STAS domain-containing protein [Candidatus Gastranaerophilales bacterium]